MTDLMAILTNFGFPVALSAYLLLRFEKTLSELSKTNSELVSKNTQLIGTIDEQSRNISELRDLLIKKGKK